MFKSCFVARVAVEKSRAVELFCTFDDPQTASTSGNGLPPAQALGGFCFPLGPDNVQPKEYMAPEEYSFTLTAGDGSRLHGFCRSFLPPRPAAVMGLPSSSLRYPQVLCVVSQYPWFAFYYKILQVVEQLLKKQDNVLNTYSKQQLAQNHPASLFLTDLCHQCPELPIPGRIIRVQYPKLDSVLSISPPKRIGWTEGADQLLASSDQFIELEIPPDFGNGSWNAGIPLARLLWHVPVHGLMTLLAALLLERRVILVAEDRDKVSAAVHAAAALLYPFRWHHIYVPLLPIALKDYLTAPMPFLIGLQASLLPSLKQLPMDEVTLVDLDLGSCEPPPGSPRDDARLLPWADRLQAALQVVYDGLRSPTEFESTPVIAHVLQEYFLRFMGRYREFVQPEGTLRDPAISPEDSAHAGPALQRPSGDIRARPSFRHSPKAPGVAVRAGADDDGYLRGDGFQFDQLAFVASQGRNEKAQNFAKLFRHSQLYEVFINERLKLAGQEYKTSDNFESKQRILTGRGDMVKIRMLRTPHRHGQALIHQREVRMQVAEAARRREKSWSAFSKAGATVQGSGASVSNLTELMHKGRNMVKTFAANHRLTSEDGELFPLRESSFVRGSGSSFGGRSGPSFSGRSFSRTAGPPNLQRFSVGSAHQSSSASRDVNSVKAQINGILHEDSLPYYDQVPQPSLPTRQTSAPPSQGSNHSLQFHTASPRSGRLSHGSRLQTQGSQVDLGDLGVSSPTGMSRANSKDTGHIASQAPAQHASGSWQGRLSRVSLEQQQPNSLRQSAQAQHGMAQRSAAQQGSAYASLEAMLSSIPETLSGMPSMPSMPSVPSMSDIEKSMSSRWSSFTGSLGLSPAPPQQQPPAPAGWVAFAEESTTQPPVATAAQSVATSSMPAALQAGPTSTAAFQQIATLDAGPQPLQSRMSVTAPDAGPNSSLGHAPLASPCTKPTGLQSIDPLTAVKAAASVPLREMFASRQDSSSASSSQRIQSASLTAQPGTMGSSAIADASMPVVDASPSTDWSDYSSAQAAGLSAMQPLPREVTQPSSTMQSQPTDSSASADLWAQWSMPPAAQSRPSDAPQKAMGHEYEAALTAVVSADQSSLLDM